MPSDFASLGTGCFFFATSFGFHHPPRGALQEAARVPPPQVSSLTMDPMANICTNFGEVGQAFITHYYQVFDNDRTQLGSLYKDEVSMLNFEHNPGRPGQFKGTAQILEKLTNLPFRKVQHQVVTIDCQPTPGGGVLVVVCGNLLVDDEQMPQKFSQVFQLLPSGTGSFYIFNDIFRLNVG